MRRNLAPTEREKPNTAETRENRMNRVAACPKRITLNGQSATISGYGKQYATVTQTSTRLSVEFSWETVFRIVGCHGKFKS